MENIFIICAHSDDQVLGVGGTILKYAKENKKVYTYILSYGESSHPWLKPEVIKDIRITESERADKILNGSGIKFFDLKETKFKDKYEETFKRLKILIEKKKPTKIFTHVSDDPHPDHRVTYNLVLDIVDNLTYKPAVYAFEVWNPFKLRQRSQPKLYVDISKQFKKKIEALKVFKSQKIQMQIPLLWTVYVRAFINGLHSDVRFAEKFYKVR